MLVDHALARFSTDNLSCMVIRFDNNRVKEVVNRAVDPIGVDGDPVTHVGYRVSEADKIVEGARKSMANTEITDNVEPAEKVMDEVLQKMADDGPGPEIPIEATSPNKVESVH